MDRKLKAVLMGAALLASVFLLLQLARVVWFLAIIMLPFLMVAGVVYVVGYGAPNLGDYGRKLHKRAEFRARGFLDWLDFRAPTWLWPVIQATRTFLDWLGLQVA